MSRAENHAVSSPNSSRDDKTAVRIPLLLIAVFETKHCFYLLQETLKEKLEQSQAKANGLEAEVGPLREKLKRYEGTNSMDSLLK